MVRVFALPNKKDMFAEFRLSRDRDQMMLADQSSEGRGREN